MSGGEWRVREEVQEWFHSVVVLKDIQREVFWSCTHVLR
jgi:hypothetical protein